MVAGFQNDPGTVQQEAGFGFNGNFWTESSLDGFTASTTQTQAGATQLTMMLNRVSTVASVGNAVRLPPALSGLEICVTNEGANSMTVFGTGSDTINGVAGATGVQQMQQSCCWYACTKAGVWSAPGVGTGYSGNFPTYSTQNVATTAGGTQGTSAAITLPNAQLTGPGSGATGFLLPPAKQGMEITIINNTANATAPTAFATGADTINGTAGSTGVATGANGTVTIYYCPVNGAWVTK